MAILFLDKEISMDLLHDAHIADANLSRTNLYDENLRGAILSMAILSVGLRSDLSRAISIEKPLYIGSLTLYYLIL